MTIIHVDTLQICVNINYVEHLNINPQQIISQLQDQLAGLKADVEAGRVEYKFVIGKGEDQNDGQGKPLA